MFTRLRSLFATFLAVLLTTIISGCATTGAAPTAPISTPNPATTIPTVDPASVSGDLPLVAVTVDGVMTVRYPQAWVADVLGTSVAVSTTPGLANQIGQRTFNPDEQSVIVVYAARSDVAAALGLDPAFTLEQLGAASENDLAGTTTEAITVSGVPAIAQTGIIAFEGILADVYAITLERDGVLVTITGYGAPDRLDTLQPVTQAIAAGLMVDASLVAPLGAPADADSGTPEVSVTAEG